jgi:hypothetical protein
LKPLRSVAFIESTFSSIAFSCPSSALVHFSVPKMLHPLSIQSFGAISFILLSALQCAALKKPIPPEPTRNSSSIDAACNGNGTSATDSAVFTSQFVQNQTVPLSWVMGIVAHPNDRDTVEVSRSFYFGPRANDTLSSPTSIQGCALFFPSASQHYNTSNIHQNPTDASLPAKCIADMTQLVQTAARNSSAQFEGDPTGTCNQIAGEIVVTHLESCFGYDVKNVHPRRKCSLKSCTLKSCPILLTSDAALSGLSNNTDDLICNPGTTPNYNLTLIEDNSLIDRKDSFGLVTMLSYSTPIITIIYPTQLPSNGTLVDSDVHYTIMKPVDYQDLLGFAQTSLASAFGISKVFLIGTLVQTALLLL